MSRLRRKLNDDPENPSFIKTIWGSGYMFIGNEAKKRMEENESI
jgi:DNA-binding response OmpR family regulator